MPPLADTLKRLAATFAVRDIMTQEAHLVCAASEEQAVRVSHSNSDYNVIPIRRDGELAAYFERDSGNTMRIDVNDLITDGTSLLDLVTILEERQFCFVLGHRRIQGYVHYSDLNHHLVKLAFYVMLEALERAAIESIRGMDDRESLIRNLGLPRFEQIEAAYKRAGDAGRDFVSYLNISDLLTLAAKAKGIHIDKSVLRAVKKARDGAAHVSKNLVSSYGDVEKLATVKRESLRILGTIQA